MSKKWRYEPWKTDDGKTVIRASDKKGSFSLERFVLEQGNYYIAGPDYDFIGAGSTDIRECLVQFSKNLKTMIREVDSVIASGEYLDFDKSSSTKE